jgi:hypothetical protein
MLHDDNSIRANQLTDRLLDLMEEIKKEEEEDKLKFLNERLISFVFCVHYYFISFYFRWGVGKFSHALLLQKIKHALTHNVFLLRCV